MTASPRLPLLAATGPRRLQLSRRSGARLPSDALSVAHPSAWANPYRPAARSAAANVAAVRHFISYLDRNPELVTRARQHLQGLNLACWCRPGLPCHGEVWLLLVNPLMNLPATAALAMLDVSELEGVTVRRRRPAPMMGARRRRATPAD